MSSISNDPNVRVTEPNGTLDSASQKGFLGHPRPLATLFSVEMWERFSFYGMQAILAYYMYYSVAEGGLGMDKALAVSLVGAYGGGVYLSTILGAWLADRVFGGERVLFYSAIMIMCGHLALALLPGGVGLAIGLILVAVGSGGLKANASVIVGTLYSREDPRRDAGFSIFYMGVNLGALVGPLLTGALQTSLGFHWGFGAAAVGMALGIAVYAFGRKNLPELAREVSNPLPAQDRKKVTLIGIAALVVIVALFAIRLVTLDNLATVISYVVAIAAIVYFTVILRSPQVNTVERNRVFAFIPLFIASVAFWALFQQQFTFIAVYSDERLDRNLFGWEMPASWVQSINPIFIIIFAGIFAALWTKMGQRQPSTPLKFALSLFIIGVAYLIFIPMESLEKTPLLVLAGILLLCTFAELLLSPIGLSISTKLAPEAFRTQMMALFYLSVSLGTTLSGVLAAYYQPGQEIAYFVALGAGCIILGVALLVATPAIKRLMGGVK
ncbi:peptide MFS transporter [Neomicrococcus lactis]|uniref:peptide MFS transporter n=1 Tax=Neomicrococcus lactis TaxID=732241 RepID=UPI002301D2F8|nr:peptide MFS transporter [Neomicrococcus lactis]